MIKRVENTIKVGRGYIQGTKNPPTTLNCFLILEKPKEKNKRILHISKLLSQWINRICEKLHFRLHGSYGLKIMYTLKQ